MNPDGVERKLAAILSADVVGYSRLMAEDEAGTVRTLTAYRQQVASLVQEHRGRVVDAPGDNVLAEFPTATDAVECAVEIQRVLQARNAALPVDRKMEFRIGIHLGEVRVKGDRLYGDGVNIAARLEGLAEAGGICISDMVHKQVGTKLDLAFEDLGEQEVKNIPEPVRAYKLRIEPAVPLPTAEARSGRWVGWVGVAALLVAAGAVTFWGVYLRALPPAKEAVGPQTAPAELADKPSLAVLPFINMSGDPEQEYFSDGITEEIITRLARRRDLSVIGRTSTYQYKGKAVDLTKVGRELGVRYILEGSVRKSAETVRVTAQLLDAAKGTHLWAETYERDLTAADLFAVQDDITGQVVASIESAYGVLARARLEETRRQETKSLGAYDCVLRAEAYTMARQTREEHFRVRECLERAVELDPDFAPAWVHLAAIYLDEYRDQDNPRPRSLDRALEAARRAVELEPTWAATHSALAETHFFRRELDLFFVEAERALALDPDNRDTLGVMGLYTACAGQWDRGVALVKKAIALTPASSGLYRFALSLDHYRKAEYEEALAEIQKTSLPEFFWTHAQLAMVYGQLGRQEEAAASLAELQRLNPDFTLKTAEGYIGRYIVQDEIVQQVLDGLRKAGLKE